MRTTSFKSMECPTARALDCIGESWTLLILRDALQGCTRFDEFQRSVGIATNTLTRRLKRLVDQGLLERRRYMTRPTRYVRADADGHRPVPAAGRAVRLGSKYLVNDGVAVQQIDRESGRVLESVVVDRNDLQPITVDRVLLKAGPVASAAVHERVEQVRELRESASGS